MKRFAIILPLLLVCSILCHSQTYTLEDLIVDVIDIDEYDEAQIDELHEKLAELEANPLNINTAEYEDFALIPLLTIDQISDIMYYRDKYGYLRTMEELSLIRSISRPMRLLLSRIFVADKPASKPWYRRPALDSLLHHGHGSVLATGSIPLYDRAGNSDYLGDKYKYSLKVKGHFGDYIKYGITGSKDDGEPFLSHGNRYGFDNYSFFLNINKVGRLESLVIGRYRMKMGEGLILNNGFSLGKQYMLTATGSTGTKLSGHSSRSDSHYLQGAAATFSLSHTNDWRVSLFYSYRYLDATLNNDGSARTLITSGYHRKQSEMDKRNNTVEMMTGAHVGWKSGGWHAGVSGVYTWYDRTLTPATALYRRYAPQGNSFWNASVDYGYLSHRLTLSGETATGGCGDIATLNMLSYRFPNSLRLTAVQRYYSYKYYALLAQSFSDGGYVQNESGIYLVADVPVAKNLKLNIYTDYAYFPWARYRVSASSYSWDNAMTLIYNRNTWNLQGRYRFRVRQRDLSGSSSDDKTQASHYEHTARLTFNREIGNWNLRTQGDWHSISYNGTQSTGYAIGETVSAKLFRMLTASLSVGYFHTNDYDSRIYLYEKGLTESFGISAFYGRGIRIAGILRADLGKQWMLAAKFGVTNYFDRDQISSSDRLIPQSYKPDVDVQVRYKF